MQLLIIINSFINCYLLYNILDFLAVRLKVYILKKVEISKDKFRIVVDIYFMKNI